MKRIISAPKKPAEAAESAVRFGGEYKDGDTAGSVAISLLASDPDICLEDARFSIEKSDKMIVYTNALKEVVGCGSFRLWGSSKDKADIYLYVPPGARSFGIGRQLLNELSHVPESAELQFISTRVETNHAQSLAFFQSAGFENWYRELILCHLGGRQPTCDLPFTSYRPEYFESYVSAIRRSFFEMRSSNDFQPYNCCEPDETKRNELEQKKDRIYILLDGDTVAASVSVSPGSIDDVFVAPEYQGLGIGRKMLWFALNKAIDSGFAPVSLSAIQWNLRALRLYESVGFHIAKRIDYLRFFISNDSSNDDR